MEAYHQQRWLFKPTSATPQSKTIFSFYANKRNTSRVCFDNAG